MKTLKIQVILTGSANLKLILFAKIVIVFQMSPKSISIMSKGYLNIKHLLEPRPKAFIANWALKLFA